MQRKLNTEKIGARMKNNRYVYIIYYVVFYFLYVILPEKSDGLILWKYYFPIKTLLMIPSALVATIHITFFKIQYYRRIDDFEKVDSIKNESNLKLIKIFFVGMIGLVFIPFMICLMLKGYGDFRFLIYNIEMQSLK